LGSWNQLPITIYNGIAFFVKIWKQHVTWSYHGKYVITYLGITYSVTTIKSKRRHTRKQLPYPLYIKDIDLDAHVPMFKAPIKANGETKYKDIVKMFMFTLKNII
jgi:hypothetical protein